MNDKEFTPTSTGVIDDEFQHYIAELESTQALSNRDKHLAWAYFVIGAKVIASKASNSILLGLGTAEEFVELANKRLDECLDKVAEEDAKKRRLALENLTGKLNAWKSKEATK